MDTNRRPLHAPSNPATQKRRPWWFYGLVAVGGLLLLAAVGFLGLLSYYTSKQPAPIAHVDITPADQEALAGRWLQFEQAIKEGQPTAPFQLSAKEINGFFSADPRLNGRIYLGLTGNTARAEVSFPLDGLLPWFGRGRFLNAIDTFKVGLGQDGAPRFEILTMTVKGRPLPRWVTRRLAGAEFTHDISGPLSDPGFRNQIKSLEIRDGCLVLTPVNAR